MSARRPLSRTVCGRALIARARLATLQDSRRRRSRRTTSTMARGAIPVDTSFPDMLLWAAAVFAIKITLMHALQVRSRLMTGDNKSSRQAHWVEDESIPDVFLKAFQVTFVTFAGPVL